MAVDLAAVVLLADVETEDGLVATLKFVPVLPSAISVAGVLSAWVMRSAADAAGTVAAAVISRGGTILCSLGRVLGRGIAGLTS